MQPSEASQSKPLPKGLHDFITEFMRSLNTSRLYAIGHDIVKKNARELHARLHDAIGQGDLLFIGCAKAAFFRARFGDWRTASSGTRLANTPYRIASYIQPHLVKKPL